MQTVKVKVPDLLARVEANRATHRAEFERALTGYRNKLLAALENSVEELRAGRMVEQEVRLPVPQDHTADYDQVIEMLKMSVDDVVEIDYRLFRQYVMDEWGWKEAFTMTNSAYQ